MIRTKTKTRIKKRITKKKRRKIRKIKEDKGEDEKDQEDKDKDEKGDPKDDKKEKGEDGKHEEQKPQPQPGQLSPQQIKNLLEAMNNQEQKVQEKMNAQKAKGVKVQTDKDW